MVFLSLIPYGTVRYNIYAIATSIIINKCKYFNSKCFRYFNFYYYYYNNMHNYDRIKYNQPDDHNCVTAIINVSIMIYEAKGYYYSYITVRQHNNYNYSG